MLLASSEDQGTVIADGRVHGHVRRLTGKFGYAWDSESLYYATQKGVYRVDPNRTEVLKHWERALSHPHQILLVGRKLLITDSRTLDNAGPMFLSLDVDSGEWGEIEVPAGRCWINSVNVIDGQIYAVAHNRGPSDVLVYDASLTLVRTISKVGVYAHNVWKMRGKLWTCCSGTGTLVALDGTERVHVGGFPRGVALNERTLYVGITAIRGSSVPLPERAPHGNDPKHGVLALDASSLTPLWFADLEKPVMDVRLLDETDRASHTEHGPIPVGWGEVPEVAAVWLSGVSGHSDVVQALVARLREDGVRAVVLDEESLRDVCPSGVVSLAKLLQDQKLTVIVSGTEADAGRTTLKNFCHVGTPLASTAPEVILDTSKRGPAECAEHIIAALRKKG